jgi:hypothetical protein
MRIDWDGKTKNHNKYMKKHGRARMPTPQEVKGGVVKINTFNYA